jgi:hypothetical protein
MQYFDENADYWGNVSKPIIAAGNGKLTARSVKMFADGECYYDVNISPNSYRGTQVHSGLVALRYSSNSIW